MNEITHYVPRIPPLVSGGKPVAVCSRVVEHADHDNDPRCPDCRFALALLAQAHDAERKQYR